MKLLVTGGAGFIGANYVHFVLREHPAYEVVVLDKLTYAGNPENLRPVAPDPRFDFVRMDICDPAVADVVRGCDAVVHFAAESHVDRSIENAAAFVRTNVEGTWNLLEACRRAGVARFVQIGTDEVYGSLGPAGKFTESTPLAPRSPYSATKAAADLMVQSYVHTFGFPAVITRCSNNYGPYQFPEKFIPLMIVQARGNQRLPVYGDGLNVRDWIHVEDHCRAVDMVLHHGREGEVYNVGGECEKPNLEVAHAILEHLGRPRRLIQYVPDRLGHDRRYAIDCAKIQRELGWQPRWNFDRGLAETIRWYEQNADWVEHVRSGAYRDYFQRHYVEREKTLAQLRSA